MSTVYHRRASRANEAVVSSWVGSQDLNCIRQHLVPFGSTLYNPRKRSQMNFQILSARYQCQYKKVKDQEREMQKKIRTSLLSLHHYTHGDGKDEEQQTVYYSMNKTSLHAWRRVRIRSSRHYTIVWTKRHYTHEHGKDKEQQTLYYSMNKTSLHSWGQVRIRSSIQYTIVWTKRHYTHIDG